MLPLKLLTSMYNFNPHPHTEGDKEYKGYAKLERDFNPHPHTEGDNAEHAIPGLSKQFQSTPSHGG